MTLFCHIIYPMARGWSMLHHHQPLPSGVCTLKRSPITQDNRIPILHRVSVSLRTLNLDVSLKRGVRASLVEQFTIIQVIHRFSRKT